MALRWFWSGILFDSSMHRVFVPAHWPPFFVLESLSGSFLPRLQFRAISYFPKSKTWKSSCLLPVSFSSSGLRGGVMDRLFYCSYLVDDLTAERRRAGGLFKPFPAAWLLSAVLLLFYPLIPGEEARTDFSIRPTKLAVHVANDLSFKVSC